MKMFNLGKKQRLEPDNGEYSDICEILNILDNKPVATYQMERQNKKSFNWGFLMGVLLSSTFWIVVIYLAK